MDYNLKYTTMDIFKFKTNINCGGCIAKVTPFLNGEQHIKHWQVDTANPQRILTVEAESFSAKEIIELLQKAGYGAELLN